jgi:peptidoglycan hydrolase-like protein with peptidoglycan-binding domain
MYIYDRQSIGSRYDRLGQPNIEVPTPGDIYEAGARAFRSFFEPSTPPPPVLTKGPIAAGRESIAVGVERAKARARHALSIEKTCWIQTILNKTSGENLVPDGLYGPRTRAAVQRFQTRAGLSADGIVGSQTNTALIQSALNQIAQASLLPVDGVMDARVQQEIKRFQSQNSLVPDGVVGPKTRAAMVLALGGRCRIPAPVTIPPPIIITNGGGQKCDKPRFEAEKQACRAQTLRALVGCGLTFGLTEAQAIGFAGSAIATSPTVAGLVVLAVAAGVTDTIAKVRLAMCAYNLIQQFKECVQAARAKTHCM